MPDRSQEGAHHIDAHTPALVDLEVGVAEVVPAVELGDLGDSALLGRIAPRVEDLPADPPLFDPEFAADAVEGIGAVGVVLDADEVREYLLPRPAAIAEGRPVVVVALLTPHVDHRVDGGTAAEDTPARVVEAAPVEAGLGLRLEAPVGPRVVDGEEVADGDPDPEVGVGPAGLEEEHPAVRVGRKA